MDTAATHLVAQVMAGVTTNKQGRAVLDRALSVLLQAIGKIGQHAKLHIMEAAYNLTRQRQTYINRVMDGLPKDDLAISPVNRRRVELALSQSFDAMQSVDESLEGEDFVSRMAEALADYLKLLGRLGDFVFWEFLKTWWPLVLVVGIAVFMNVRSRGIV